MEIHTYQDFMFVLQKMYGPYVQRDSRGNIVRDQAGKAVPLELKNFLFEYLNDEIDEKKLSKLFDYIKYSHPVNYGPPDISAIEKAINDAIRNGKGSDVHKIKPFSTSSLTDKEIEGCERVKPGVLKAMFQEVVKNLNHQKNRKAVKAL